MVRKKWQNSMMNSQAYNCFASTGSDHRIVTARVRLSLRANSKTQPKKMKYDWSLLQKDPEIQDKYSVEVRNKYTILNDLREDKSVHLYGAETWTITGKIQKSLDGCYTRMLRAALNISWKDKITNHELYGELPLLSQRAKTSICWALSQKPRRNSIYPCSMDTPTRTQET